VATATTSTTGTFSVAVRPTVNTRYRAVFVGMGPAAGAYSNGFWVKVAPAVSIVASRSSITYRSTITLSTTVAPVHAGRPVLLQLWTGTSWATIATVPLSSSSTASAVVRPPNHGINSYRWATPADADHDIGRSAAAQIRVS
jgi:hypothetical protein